MYDLRARDYDPSSGRFTANDPVAVPTGMPYVAGYSYSFNNPLTRTDANGRASEPDWGQLGKLVFSGLIAAGTIIVETYDAIRNQDLLTETITSVNEVSEMNGGGSDGAWASANVHFNPLYGIVSATVGGYEACLDGRPGDAAIEVNTAILTLGIAGLGIKKLANGSNKNSTDNGAIGTGTGRFGGLTQVEKYGGIRPYNKLKADLKGSGLEAHHLIEQRFERQMAQSRGTMLSIALTIGEHRAFTNAWRREIPYNGPGVAYSTVNATRKEINAAASRI